jgi:FkbM family methyltransferase
MRYFNLLKSISNWPLYFKSRRSKDPSEVFVFHTRNGIAVQVPRQVRGEFREIFLDQSYMAHLDVNFPPEPVIIDIGANVGIFSLFMAFRFVRPRIFAYEPIPLNFKQLKSNLDSNKSFAVMRCYQKAVSNHLGNISLSYEREDGFTVMASMLNATQGNTIQVQSTTLPEIFEENKIAKCDLLKLDCEGGEYPILFDCPQRYLSRISQIVMEVHGSYEPNYNIESLERYLRERGFKTISLWGRMLWAHQTGVQTLNS